jgi:hypothetical protein
MTLSPKASSLAAATAALALATFSSAAFAQATPSAPAPSTGTIAYSSSAAANPFAGEDLAGQYLGSAPNGTMKVAPQYGGGGYGGGRYHRDDQNGRFSHLALEFGGGFSAPIGNAASGGFTTLLDAGTTDTAKYPTETWGGNFFVGGGWNFTKKFALLGEYSYNAMKIPGSTLSAVYYESDLGSQGIGAIGGNTHTQGVTAEALYYYYAGDKHTYSAYVIGGGGFYHKSTNFTTPVEEEDFYGDVYEQNVTFSSYSDNAPGLNIGTGLTFKPFGQYSPAKLFAEARFVFVDTPGESSADITNNNVLHTGSQEYIPVSVGIRF